MSAIVVQALTIYGIAIVVAMVVAVLIRTIVAVLDTLERPAHAAAAAVRTELGGDAAIAPEIVAAISAAVQMMPGDHRIVHIEATHRSSGWVVEGRQAHHASHLVDHAPRQDGAPPPRGVKR